MKQGKFIISADPPEPTQEGPLAAEARAGVEDVLDEGPDAELRPFTIEAGRHGERLDRAGVAQHNLVGLIHRVRRVQQFPKLRRVRVTGNDDAAGLFE